MATISDLWAAFTAFQESADKLKYKTSYYLVLYPDGYGAIRFDTDWDTPNVIEWEDLDDGLRQIKELIAANQELAKNG